MTPPTADRKISSTTLDLITKTLNKKADEPWVKDMLAIHKEGINEAKSIALAVKKDFNGRDCKQEEVIKEMARTIQGWQRVKLGVFITAFMFLALGLAQFLTLKNQADNTEKTQTAMGISVVKIEQATNENTVMFKEHIQASEDEKVNKEEEKEQLLDDIEKVVRSAIKKKR